jgi:ABC-2 type transport system permease protein
MSLWEIKFVKGLKRYIRLFGYLIRISLMRQMDYRLNFIFMITGKIIRIGLLFLFFQAIFLNVSRIGQWSYNQVLLLFATFHLVDFIISITFQRNLAFHLPRRIQSGELDTRMILPVNLLFIASFEDIDLIDFFSFLPTLGFLGYVLYYLDFAFTWTQLLLYILLIANALVFLFAVVLIVATISFWTIQSYGLARIFDNLLRIGRYPLDIFEGALRGMFIYILPLVLVAQVPAQALLNSLSPRFLAFSFTASNCFLVLALKFWKLGLKNYSSAST